MRVAIVTFEFEGLTRNGGIGTAYRRLAELLVSRGHRVTVVFLPVELNPGERAGGRWSDGIRRLARRGIRVVIPGPAVERAYFLGRSRRIHRYLLEGRFDLVHGADNCGLLYAALEAKRSGQVFQKTRFVIGAHGPRLWSEELEGRMEPSTPLMTWFDRRSVAMADTVVSPSRYMLGYLRSKGWKLPGDVRVIPNVNRLGNAAPKREPAERRGPRALVFFGRLEARKGVFLFAEALCLLIRREPHPPKPIEIVFLGKDPDGKTVKRLRQRLAPLRKRIRARFLTALSSEDAQQLLSRMAGALVCVPSIRDNSPYALVEAIESGWNILATRAGGIPELLEARDRRAALCGADAESLCEALRSRLLGPRVTARASREALLANSKWIRFHSRSSSASEA